MILRMISEKHSAVLTRMVMDSSPSQVGIFFEEYFQFYKYFADLTHILETLGERMDPVETEEMMLLADEDGDGNINYEEFISMLFKVSVWKCILIKRYILNISETSQSRI